MKPGFHTPAVSALVVHNLTKSYGATAALRAVDLDVPRGGGLALLGRNGAGKSTLIKLLAGVERADEGSIEVDGRPVTPGPGVKTGLAFIHQDLGLIDSMTVAENIAFDRGYPTRGKVLVSWSRLHRQTQDLLDEWDLQLLAADRVSGLSQVNRSLVAIARALSTQASCVVLDEPTASLPSPEVYRLLAAVARVREKGVAIVYVTHRLSEIVRVADQFVVLRNGTVAEQGDVAKTPHDDLVRFVVGEDERDRPSAVVRRSGGECLLSLQRLGGQVLKDASIEVRAGEILGLAGLEGSGHQEVGRIVAGVQRATSGAMVLRDDTYDPSTPAQARASKVAFLAGDRVRESAVMPFSCTQNYHLRAGGTRRVISHPAERRDCADVMREWGVVAGSEDAPMSSLSGGNQQKLLVAKWLDSGPRVFVAEEPTAGVDVGARRTIHERLRASVGPESAVIVTSSDSEEIAELCDRVVVFRAGRSAIELTGADVTEARVAAESMKASVPSPLEAS
jgi:ribose transport system ATP-binding protein